MITRRFSVHLNCTFVSVSYFRYKQGMFFVALLQQLLFYSLGKFPIYTCKPCTVVKVYRWLGADLWLIVPQVLPIVDARFYCYFNTFSQRTRISFLLSWSECANTIIPKLASCLNYAWKLAYWGIDACGCVLLVPTWLTSVTFTEDKVLIKMLK